MAILDLQKLEPKKSEESSAPAHGKSKSGASKGCNNTSGFSLLLC